MTAERLAKNFLQMVISSERLKKFLNGTPEWLNGRSKISNGRPEWLNGTSKISNGTPEQLSGLSKIIILNG